jgi:hypothetical protein
MKLAIVGSRTFNDYELLLKTMSLFEESHRKFITLVSGGAIGADSLGERWADYWGIEIERYLPDWNRDGKAAGFIRNQSIVDACDMVLVFWDGKSKGTQDSINKARLAKKPTFIVYF